MLHAIDSLEEERFQVRVAWLYHVEGLTQASIADHLGVTRLRVNRALGEALRNGVVKVSIHSAFAPCLELEARFKERYGLSNAVITPEPADDENVQAVVGAELGRYISLLLTDPAIKLFGIGWGNTLNIATRAVKPSKRDDLEIISVMGGLSRGSDVNSFEITTRLANLYAAERTYMTAPLFASTEESRDIIMVQDVFQEVLTRIRQADAIAMGVGDISDRSLLIRNGLPKDVTGDDLIAAGAVGDMLGFFVDAEGGPIDHPITRRVIGIDPFELKSRPNVILAAGGAHKVAIIRAALGSGIFDVLVTDQRTAEAVLGE
ncbi:MAG: sugar-binding transcriptional regulator [Kiloniellales bacterium]|nr:sugar-binding transcriptional regulator [Kiloniellales bacterium]